MFFRPLVELLNFIAESTAADNVEVYYRFIFSERRGTAEYAGCIEKGCRAFTRIRWQRNRQEWSVGLGGMIPTIPGFTPLFKLVSPRNLDVPIPDGKCNQTFSVSTREADNANVSGWFRDLMVTDSGIRLFAEGQFAYYENDIGIWNQKPVRPDFPGGGTSLFIPPVVVLKLLEAGVLKGSVCRKPCCGFFHRAFDFILPETGKFCRTPNTLDPFTGAIGVSFPHGKPGGGVFCDDVEIGGDGTINFYSDGTKNWALPLSMLKSLKKVSEEVQLYRNNIMFLLPWVELEGGTEWHLP